MNTFLLKTGCLVLFGFIFFLSFQAENASTNQPLIGQQESIELIEQNTVVIAVDAITPSTVNIETVKGFTNGSFNK